MEDKMTKKYILTGGPGIGKTTILKLLSGNGLYIINETATYLIEKELKKPENEQIVPWTNPQEFQRKVYENQRRWEEEIPKGIERALLDRSLADNLAYLKLNNLEGTKVYEDIKKYASENRYEKIFLLDQLPFKEETAIRRDIEVAGKIHELIQETYRDLGYKLERIPVLEPKERAELVYRQIHK
jgi:predicted ATPase